MSLSGKAGSEVKRVDFERRVNAVERALIGQHPAITKLRALIEKVAPSDVTILISGESGVGKEVVARAIHSM
ncbi:MAG TPA: sigma 54-interacting transcriptional regulator, partial [Candidatus Binataceae bacterium]